MPLLLSGPNTHEGARVERDHERQEAEIKERKLVGGMKTESFSQVLFKMLSDAVKNLVVQSVHYQCHDIRKRNIFLCIGIQ